MGMNYYFDSNLPQYMVSDLILFFENVVDRCPSDSMLTFCLLSAGGKLCLEVTLNSASMHIKERLQGSSYRALKSGLKNIKSRLEGWRNAPLRGDA